jgi:hypothetical protein
MSIPRRPDIAREVQHMRYQSVNIVDPNIIRVVPFEGLLFKIYCIFSNMITLLRGKSRQ